MDIQPRKGICSDLGYKSTPIQVAGVKTKVLQSKYKLSVALAWTRTRRCFSYKFHDVKTVWCCARSTTKQSDLCCCNSNEALVSLFSGKAEKRGLKIILHFVHRHQGRARLIPEKRLSHWKCDSNRQDFFLYCSLDSPLKSHLYNALSKCQDQLGIDLFIWEAIIV